MGRTRAPAAEAPATARYTTIGWSTTIAAATTAAPAARRRLTATSTRSGRGARVASTTMLTTIAGSIRNSDTRPTATAPPASYATTSATTRIAQSTPTPTVHDSSSARMSGLRRTRDSDRAAIAMREGWRSRAGRRARCVDGAGAGGTGSFPTSGNATESRSGWPASDARRDAPRVAAVSSRPRSARRRPAAPVCATASSAQAYTTSASVGSGRAPSERIASWKPADVERGAHPALGLLADPEQLQLAGLVGERLAGQRDVAVDLVGDGARRERGVGEHVVDRLLAGPAHRVDAGVDDEPRRPPGVERQHPEPVEVAGVEAHLVGQPLGVQAPALEVGRRPEVAAEVRQPAELLAERDLEVVAGHRLVVRERLGLVARPVLRVGRVDDVLAGPRAVLGGRAVVGRADVVLLVRGHLEDHARGQRQAPEPPGHDLAGALEAGGRLVEHLLPRGEEQRRGPRAAPTGRARATRRRGCVPRARRSRGRCGRSRRARCGGAAPRRRRARCASG